MNREIHYLYGGNGLAAIYVKTDGKDTLFAAVTDRQNSLTAVMDVATGKIEKFSYKPWGMRRNPANWSENVVTDYPARFSRGYCMHEHMPQLGLINMGGRIFDERTNQFLSADPYRQAPESWLNCNRFGYCMGNPVMYTDPDGEEVNSYYDFSSSNCGFSSTSSYISTIYGIQNGNGTYEYTSFNNQYGFSTIPSILNSNCDYASIYASCNPVNNMPSFISAQQSVDRAYAQVQQGIQNAIACANATAANAQTVSVSLGQSGSGVNPLTITGMPSNSGATQSTIDYSAGTYLLCSIIGNTANSFEGLKSGMNGSGGSIGYSKNVGFKYYEAKASYGGNGFFGNQYISTVQLKNMAQWFGRIGTVGTVSMSGYNIYQGVKKDGNTFGINAQRATVRSVGSWAGAVAGGKIGVMVGGPICPPWGSLVLGTTFAVIGGLGGEYLFNSGFDYYINY